MKRVFIVIIFGISILLPAYSFGVEIAPRISDREIIEGLANIRGDIKEIRADIRRLEDGLKTLTKRIDQVEKSINQRISQIEINMNQRFDDLRWMMGLFISISLIILGFVLRMQWQMNRRQAQMETTLETHKDGIAFLKDLIQKLLPPKGVL